MRISILEILHDLVHLLLGEVTTWHCHVSSMLLLEIEIGTLALSSRIKIDILDKVLAAVLVSIDLSVASLARAVSSLVGVVSVVHVSWGRAETCLVVLLPQVVSEHLLREESSAIYINLLLDHLVADGIAEHVRHPAGNALALVLLVLVLLWILNGREVLLLLVQVVLVNLFLELDVLFVNSVDLLSEVLMLPLESLGQLVLLLDLLHLLVVHVSLDLHLISESDEFLCLWHNLHEGILVSVACWLALFGLEGSLTHLD